MVTKLKELAEWFYFNYDIHLYMVGGCVRDEIMGHTAGDIDVCVVGGKNPIAVQALLEMLKSFGHIHELTSVHGDFPIWIVEIGDSKYEFAMARTERKNGISRTEFETTVTSVTIEEDLLRRDLTINAIAKSLVTGNYVDPYDGEFDITRKNAHPVSDAFKEDPLRVYRAARFIATFELHPSAALIRMCRELSPEGLSNERVGMELKKMMKSARKPSLFFNFLKDVGWLHYHFPEIHALIGVPQSPKHHPEGDVYNHTMHCIDECIGDWFTRTVMLCHDLGKPATTKVTPVPTLDFGPDTGFSTDNIQRIAMEQTSKISAHGHELAGVEPTRRMLQRIMFDNHKTIRKIALLVELHMIRIFLTPKNRDKVIRPALRRMMEMGIEWPELVLVCYSDMAGRPPKPKPEFDNMVAQMECDYVVELLKSGAMEPIVTGKKLMELGIQPGPEMGKMVTKALELQDRGTLTNDNWIKVLKGCGFPSLKKFDLQSNTFMGEVQPDQFEDHTPINHSGESL